jgi:protein-S-isoprenylcysteine O-methyltransferase Ste14
VPYVAAASWLVYIAIAIALRTWLHYRATGSTGLAGARRGASALERIAGVLLVASFALSLLGPFVGAPVLGPGTATVAGVVLVTLGTAGTFGAQLAMRTSWRIGVDPKERTELVTDGPYRWVRNPIFTAMTIAGIGIALTCPTQLAIAAPIVLVLGLELQVRLVEEPYLRSVHGNAYVDWARRTGRFVPWIGGLRG